MASLNICLISREFVPDTAFGGIATFSLDTARLLKANGHRVTVLSQSLGADAIFEIEGIEVHKLALPRLLNSYRFLPGLILGFNAVVFKRLRQLHSSRPFDLVDAPDHLAEGLFAALFSGLPVVTRMHTPFALIVELGLNDYRKGLSYRFIKLMERLAITRSKVLYAPCMDLVQRCQALFGGSLPPVKTFGYPLDLAQFAPPAAPRPPGPLRILFLGRLEQRKGIETIVAAFPLLVARHPDVTLTILGSDTPNIAGYSSARSYMEDRLRSAGCLENVSFIAQVPLTELPAMFHSHDIVWVPSLYDNYPLVALEALACANAVVAADSGGLPEMIQNGVTGLLFPVGNAAALAEQTALLCADPALRAALGQAAHKWMVEECSPRSLYDNTMELYRMALNPGSL